MTRTFIRLLAAFLFAAPCSFSQTRPAPSAKEAPSPVHDSPAARKDAAKALSTLDQLPLSFQPNLGQTDGRVQWLAQGPAYTLFLTGHDAVLKLEKTESAQGSRGPLARMPREVSATSVRMQLVDANLPTSTVPEEPQSGKSNYFTGNDPSKWQHEVPMYGRVRMNGVYPGVDLAYYGHRGELEYDFLVAPHADASAIQLAFEGTIPSLTASGDLTLPVDGVGGVRLGKPVVYQMKDGARQPVDASFTIAKNNQVSFALGNYDHTRELVIDPKLLFLGALSTGSSITNPLGMSVDPEGNLYIVGQTLAADLPVSDGAYIRTCGAPFSEATASGTSNYVRCGNTYLALMSGFVSKISADGTTLLYSTYLRGSLGNDYAADVTVDASGNAWVLGDTDSSDFPITSDAVQTLCSPIIPFITFGPNPTGYSIPKTSGCNAGYDAYGNKSFVEGPPSLFLAKLDPAGSALLYSTFFGGSGQVYPIGLALDSAGDVYFTAYDSNENVPSNSYPNNDSDFLPFPTTTGGLQHIGDGQGVATLTKLDSAAHNVLYSTLLGGTDAGYFTTVQPNALAVGQKGIAFLGGYTTASTFPTTVGSIRPQCALSTGNSANCLAATGWVSAIDTTKSGSASLLYSTFLTGTDTSYDGTLTSINGITADSDNNLYATGSTADADFATAGAYQTSCGSTAPAQCFQTAFAAKINPTGTTLDWASYLGDTNFGLNSIGYGVALDSLGRVNIYGDSADSNFPSLNPISSDASGQKLFASTFSPDGTQLIFSTRVGNDANVLSAVPYNGLAIDTKGNLYLAGSVTDNGTLVTTTGTYATTSTGPYQRAVFVKISAVLAPTTTSLTVSPSTTTTDQEVTFTATVAGSTQTTPAPTGTVTLTNASVTPNALIGTINLGATGSGTFSTKQLAVGTYAISATYSSDTVYDVSTVAAPVSLTITTPAIATISLTVPSSAKLGAAVSIRTTVSGTPGTPTGTVYFFDGTTMLGSSVLSGGTASYSTSSLSAGSHSITATYDGDSVFGTTTSAASTIDITTTTTPDIALTVPATAVLDAPVQFSVTLAGASGIPTGTVAFLDGTTTLGSATLTAGKASYSTSTLIAGAHSITASYSGDPNFNPVVSMAQTVTITLIKPMVGLTVTPTTTTIGTSVSLSVTVSGTPGTPSGTVKFLDGTTVLGTATLASASASYATTTLAAGTHSITASYSGDSSFSPVVSTAQTVTITLIKPAVNLTVSPATATVGAAISLSATVSGTAGTPSGAVQFLDGATVIGTGTLASGSASYSTTALTAGTHSITASYSGDSSFSPVVSTALTVMINAVPPSVSLSANPPTVTIKSGSKAMLVLTVTPVGGFTGGVIFACGKLPPEASCSFSPETVTVTSVVQTSTLTITTSSAQARLDNAPLPGVKRRLPEMAVTICLLLPLCIRRRRLLDKAKYSILLPLSALTVVLASGALSGCSGGSTPAASKTPAGSYSISVTATTASGTASTVLQVTVQ